MYKALTEENIKDFKNFKYSEIICKCKGKYCNGTPVSFSYDLASNLQKIREHFNKPLIITSALRCEKWNKEQGGVSNSKHKKGWATDFYINGVSYNDLYNYVKKLPYFSYAYRINKNQDVIHYDITPPEETIIIKGVERDENKNQLKVNATQLRARKEPSTKSDFVGFVETNAYYDYLETKDNEDYTWYKITDDIWIANIKLDILPKKENELEKLKKENAELKEYIAELQKTIDTFQEKIYDIKEILKD